MNKWKLFWDKIRSNPIFVAAWTAFAGALGKEILTAYTTHKLDFSLQSWQQMGGAALSTAAIALVHLYMPQPNPTVPAITPPSTEIKDVPAKPLEPIDPKAQPVKEN